MTNAGDGSLELQGGASVDRAAALSARVLELHEDRCNCAQSLACAFADIAQVDADTLFVLMEGFGAGMGLPNMKKYSDEMDIQSTVGVGTTVTMVVKIPQ